MLLLFPARFPSEYVVWFHPTEPALAYSVLTTTPTLSWHARVLDPSERLWRFVSPLIPLLPSLTGAPGKDLLLCKSPGRSRKVLLYPGLVLRVHGVTTGRNARLFWGRVQKISHPAFSLLGKPTCG